MPSVVKLFVEEARSRNIVFRTEQPFNEASYVFIDRIRIAQVLRSILDNAFRCTSDGGSIVICVTKVAQLSISSGVVDSKHRYLISTLSFVIPSFSVDYVTRTVSDTHI